MIKTSFVSLAAVAAGIISLASPAMAEEKSYRVDANADTTINLDICSPSVEVYANGDDDTDLDFWIYDNNGNQVHSDVDNTDLTIYTVRNNNAGGGRCLPYRLKVHNYGNVYNQMTLRLTDSGSSGGGGGGGQTGVYAQPNNAGQVHTFTVRADANSNQSYALNLCSPSVYAEIRGDHDTDLDFWITDENGREVHSDTDSTDITFATLNTGRSRGNCVNYSLRIRNYGNVYNNVEIKLTDQ